jgi:hypothetical protein
MLILIQHDRIRYDFYILQWQGHSSIHISRYLVRYFNNLTYFLNWYIQNYLATWDLNRLNIDLEATTKNLNYNCIPTSRSTHPSLSVIKVFNIKTLLDKLLIATNLHIRHLNKYQTTLYSRYKTQTEDN